MKRIKTPENYAETITAMSENVGISSTAKLPNCQHNKSSIKTRSLCGKRGYFTFFHQLKAIPRYC